MIFTVFGGRSDELGVNRVLLGTLGGKVNGDDPEGSKRLHADVRTVARPREPNWRTVSRGVRCDFLLRE